MRILLAGNYFYPEHIGGVEVVSYNLVKHYRLQGHDVRWAAADVKPTLRKKEKDDIAIKAWNITEEKLGFPHPIPAPGTLFRLIKHVKWCDVIHLQDCLYPINIQIFILAKILMKPILITQHTKIIPYKNKLKLFLQLFAIKLIARFMHFNADKSVFVSQQKHDSLGFITDHIDGEVISNGVDTDAFHPVDSEKRKKIRSEFFLDDQKPILLFAGRFVEIKGSHLLIPIIKKHNEWNWILVGRPDDYDPSTWDFPNIVYFPQLDMQDMQRVYAAADILVHPSIGEISLIVLESMSCGTPVLLSNSLLQYTPKEEHSFFFSVQREIKEIEERLIQILRDSNELSVRRTAVREFAKKHHSWKSIAVQYLLYLSDLSSC